METIKLTPYQANIIKVYLQQEIIEGNRWYRKLLRSIFRLFGRKNTSVNKQQEILLELQLKRELTIKQLQHLIDVELPHLKITKSIFKGRLRDLLESTVKYSDDNDSCLYILKQLVMLEVLERLQLTLNNEATENPV